MGESSGPTMQQMSPGMAQVVAPQTIDVGDPTRGPPEPVLLEEPTVELALLEPVAPPLALLPAVVVEEEVAPAPLTLAALVPALVTPAPPAPPTFPLPCAQPNAPIAMRRNAA